MKTLGFLISALVWAAFTCAPVLVAVPKSNPDYNWLLLFLLFVSSVETGLLWSFVHQATDLSVAVRWGASLGFLVPSVWGYLLAKVLGSFEAQPLIVMGLVLGIPSAIGGALAGWIQWRVKVKAGSSQASISGD